MINNLENIIVKDFPFLKDSKLLLTVSGGIDSIVLTHLLHQLGYTVSIAHCNFCLRGNDSDKDQQFVHQTASMLNIPFYVTHFNTKQHAKQHKLSIQEAARNLRYNWFEEMRKQYDLDYILTAHNLNDSLETFLINLTRGTGLKGLTGIANINKKIIRPISSFTRREITDFAIENKIIWREDKSNADIKYTRNKIRHQVIPVLEKLNPNLLDSFKQTLNNLQGTEDIVKDAIDNIVEKENREKREENRDRATNNEQHSKLKTQHSIFNIQNLTFKIKSNPKAYIHELFSPYGFANSTDIENILTAQSGKQLFSKTHRLIKNRDYLLLVKKNQKLSVEKQEGFVINENDIEFNIQHSKFKIQNSSFSNQHSKISIQHSKFNAVIDKDLLNFPLIVRKWQKGDYFYPKGMQGKKKLSKYFKDEKLSLLEKENIWLLLSNNKIVWIIGMRQDNRFIITNKTSNITTITIL